MEKFICLDCNNEFPLTKEFFTIKKNSKTGFNPRCKQCIKIRELKYKKIGGELKECSKCKRTLPNNTDYFFRRCKNGESLESCCKECKGKHFSTLLTIPDGFKKCSKCGEIKPKLNTYFYYIKRDLNVFAPECITCRKEYERKTLVSRVAKANYRLKSNPYLRMISNFRTRSRDLLQRNIKSWRTLEAIGVSKEELIAYLENLFSNKMSWENYGRVWVIDHIIPCSWFEIDNIKDCFHYTNLQPLFRKDNAIKSDNHDDRIIYSTSKSYITNEYIKYNNYKIKYEK